MKKRFNDGYCSASVEARFIGEWRPGVNAYASDNLGWTDMVRLEDGKRTTFVYDPGKVYRHMKGLL